MIPQAFKSEMDTLFELLGIQPFSNAVDDMSYKAGSHHGPETFEIKIFDGRRSYCIAIVNYGHGLSSYVNGQLYMEDGVPVGVLDERDMILSSCPTNSTRKEAAL